MWAMSSALPLHLTDARACSCMKSRGRTHALLARHAPTKELCKTVFVGSDLHAACCDACLNPPCQDMTPNFTTEHGFMMTCCKRGISHLTCDMIRQQVI